MFRRERPFRRLRVVDDRCEAAGGSLTMSLPIEMPQLSSEGESATLASWLVAEGDSIEAGEVIAELETDKSTVELEAPATGMLAEIKVPAGTEDVAPGTVLATIEGAEAEASPAEGDEGVDSGDGSPENGRESRVSQEKAPSTPAEPAVPAATGPEHPRKSTPLARRAAEGRGIDLGQVAGSGPGGRIVEADVLRLGGDASVEAPERPAARTAPEGSADAASAPVVDASGEYSTERLSAMRKTIAKRMAESKREVPHFYLRMRCEMDAVMAARQRLNEGLAEEKRDIKISVNDFVVRAVALALRAVPAANVQFAGNEMRVFERVDVSVAVATEGGLVTPIVRGADGKGLVALAEEVKSLALAAREGSLRPEQYQGGTITVSNLGMYGIETVYPIVNPPQACIVGVGAAEEIPVVRDGEVTVGRVASFTLAADHRAVDGAVGAQLLAALRERLEDPMSMVL